MWTLVVLFLILYIYWFYLVKVKKGPNEAKGPTPLPILSNLYQVLKADKIIFLALHKLSLEYGPVYTLFLGPKKHVVVSGVSELKELMHNPAFDDRSWPPQKRIMDEVYSGQTQKENPSNLGILFASGETWRQNRRFTMRALRDHGFGKKTAETFILEEAQYLIEHLKEGKSIVNNFNELFTMMSLNVVWQMAAGERFNYDEGGMTKLLQFMQSINEILWELTFSPLTPMPFLKNLPPYSKVVEKAHSKMNSLRQFYRDTIKSHQSTFDANSIRDVIDAFLASGESKSDMELMVILSDLFLAGSETTGKSMEWACLFMILHPEIQEKVQKEIDLNIGNSEEVIASDRSRLPYTEAVLHEVWRCGPVGPIAATRCPKEDTQVGKYIIPAGTVVFPNLYSMTQDATLWGPDAASFNPDRFIKNGKFQNDWWDFTFGSGRRKCLGESVARVENFLFFANLLKNFKLEIPEGCARPLVEPMDGMTIGPKHFSVKLTSR